LNSFFCRQCYSRAVVPLLWGGAHLLALWNSKIRAGLVGREGLVERVAAFRHGIGEKQVLLFHCASAGELEALKPLAPEFNRSEVALAVSYFSPSARAALHNHSEFDFADFSPVDSATRVRAYLDALRPAVIAVTKHDVWPNMIWCAAERGIALFMINGNFHAGSLKCWPLVRGFQSSVYGEFRRIFTVSEEDAVNARHLVGDRPPVEPLGDSRFDRVLQRASERNPLPDGVEPACRGRTVIVAGSTHKEDEELLLPVASRLRTTLPNLLVVCVPHDPSAEAKARVAGLCARHALSMHDLNSGVAAENTAVLLVNRTGVLADLYRIGHVALVGGGFGKGVHSVLEPMACGLPVICGPNIVVSHEARVASREEILRTVCGWKEAEDVLGSWLSNEDRLRALRSRAESFVRARGGVARRLAQHLTEALHV
jgi:3-deoxy-D-manno-octulosonic-acid transferase